MFALLRQPACRVLVKVGETRVGFHSNKPSAININSACCSIRTFHWAFSVTPVHSFPPYLFSRLMGWKRVTTSLLWVTQTANGWVWAKWCGCWKMWMKRGLISRWSLWWTATLPWYAILPFPPIGSEETHLFGSSGWQMVTAKLFFASYEFRAFFVSDFSLKVVSLFGFSPMYEQDSSYPVAITNLPRE